jgi:hypothetical protein
MAAERCALEERIRRDERDELEQCPPFEREHGSRRSRVFGEIGLHVETDISFGTADRTLRSNRHGASVLPSDVPVDR